MLNHPTEASDLDARIRAAFEANASSQIIVTLITTVERATREADARASDARARALDPTLASNGMNEARREMHDAAFESERLRVAVTKLRERLAEVTADEENARRLQAYEDVEAECDVLAAELKQLYPEFSVKLADLLTRIAANDQAIEHVNRNLPRNRGRLLSSELLARDEIGWVLNGQQTAVKLTDECRLPRFHLQPGAGGRLLWPPMG